ncbi:MAG: hypothetical protein WBH56_11145, partial [Bacteroidota bacterium]
MTIALVYNSKEEASHSGPRSSGQPTTPSNPDSSDPVSSARVDTAVRTLDDDYRTRVDDQYAEWDAMETILAIKDALEKRFVVHLIRADEEAYEKLRSLQPRFVFNIAEGEYGVSREAQMPAIFEMLQLPYLGSDPL